MPTVRCLHNMGGGASNWALEPTWLSQSSGFLTLALPNPSVHLHLRCKPMDGRSPFAVGSLLSLLNKINKKEIGIYLIYKISIPN